MRSRFEDKIEGTLWEVKGIETRRFLDCKKQFSNESCPGAKFDGASAKKIHQQRSLT